ncbi:MAG: ABC transporter substrate-binding protein [Pseudomonadota bacterium]
MTSFTKHARTLALAAGVSLFALSAMPTDGTAQPETLVIDLVNEPSSLDPHRQWNPDSYYVYRNIFDQLLTRTDDGEIVPNLATDWAYADDSSVIFTIRDDVAFHDGEMLTADDVVYSIERITDPDFASPQLGQYNQITGAEALSPTEVRVTTNGPYPALLAQLVKLSIVPQHYVEEVGDDAFNQAPVGSGPYQFGEWDRGVQVSVERFDDYWGEPGFFPRAEFRAVPDAATRVANLLAGEANLIVTIDPDLALQLEANDGVEPRFALTERVGYLKLNTQVGPTADPRVREAIASAIDAQLIIDGLLGGFDAPTSQMLSPAHFGWVDGIERDGYDLDHAQALIAEVGDAALEPMVFATAPVFDQRIVQALQQMLTEAGFNVEIEMTDMAAYLARAQSAPDQQADMSFGRWSCACQDADGVLFPLLHSSSNWSTWSDAEMNALLETARGTLDEDERMGAYQQVHNLVVDQVPLVPLYQAAILYGVDSDLVWQPTPNESMFLNRMSWAD